MRYLVIWGIFSITFWLIFKDVFRWLINSWIHNSFYQHGFIIVLFCLVLIILNGLRIRKVKLHFGANVLLWVASFALVSLGHYYRFGYLIALSYSLCSLALSRSLLEQEYARHLQWPFLLMVLVFPLPFLYEMSGYLSFASAKASAFLLQLLYPSVVVDGIEIFIPPHVRFSIGINCSGANSILVLLTIVIIGLMTIKNKAAVTYAVLFLTLPVGFLTNVLRIVCIFAVASKWGMEMAMRLWHDFAGYFFYVVSLAVIFLIWWGLHHINKDKIRLRRLLVP